MNWLARVKFWQWFLFVTVASYLVWNPFGFSLFDFWRSSWGWDIKAIATVPFLLVFGVLVFMAWHSRFATAVAAGLVAVAVAFFWHRGWMTDGSSVQYWGPLAVAFALTIGFQWRRIWRSGTGEVATYDVDLTD